MKKNVKKLLSLGFLHYINLTLKYEKLNRPNSASPDIESVMEISGYAIDAGIEVKNSDNMLQTRNRLKGRDSRGCN